MKTLRRAKPEVTFSLETITRDPLQVPCLAEKYSATLPDEPGSDLARRLRIVRANEAGQLAQVSWLAPNKQAEVEADCVGNWLRHARNELGL